MEPITGLHLAAAAQAEQNRVGNVSLQEPELRGFGSINGELKPLQIARLLDPQVHRAANVPNPVSNLRGNPLIARHISAKHLNVKRRGEAEVNGLAHDVRRQEVKRDARKIPVQCQTQIADILRRRPMPLAQGYEDIAIGWPRHPAVTVAEVNAGDRQANVVEYALEFSGRNLTAEWGPHPVGWK